MIDRLLMVPAAGTRYSLKEEDHRNLHQQRGGCALHKHDYICYNQDNDQNEENT
jgi:hypothetical protein